MSKKKDNKTAKKSVLKKKTTASKPAKKVLKKAAAKKKIVPKAGLKKAVKKPLAKKVLVKKKASVKAAKPTAKKTVKKTQPKKVVAKKASAPVTKKIPAKSVTKVAVKKAEVSVKQSQPVFPSVKKVEVPLVPQKITPEPKGKFELEYTVHTSTAILYEFLTTSSGLSEWFCDDVNSHNGIYSFRWDGNVQNAKLVKAEEERLARFQWLDKNDGTYFEFRIERDDLTNDISLIVVDFADSADERVSTTLLWDSQIEKLLSVLGSH
jgi:uncharacterized protein YndB with AHSA1/START domain